jgi:thioredoxin 1
MREICSLDNIKKDALVLFWAPWCPFCIKLINYFEKIEIKYKNFGFYKVEFEKNEKLGEEFGVYGVPTAVFLKDGKEADKIIGFHPNGDYIASIKILTNS